MTTVEGKTLQNSELKQICLDLILRHGVLIHHQQDRIIPPHIARFLLKNPLKPSDVSFIAQNSFIPSLSFPNFDSLFVPVETRRVMIASLLKSLVLIDCSLPSRFLDASDLACAQSGSCQIESLVLENVYLRSSDPDLMNNLGRIMERVRNLRFGSIQANDSVLQSDEIFTSFARSHLSKNKTLTAVDLRASNVDIMAANSRRNLTINFAGEMRRWARRLKGIAFETDTNIIRTLRIINRQCPLLRAICVKNDYSKGSSVISLFDNLRSQLDFVDSDLNSVVLEPMPKLRSLCLGGHFKVFDHHLISILASVSGLKYLNVSGCPVNFDRYWDHLPESLEELFMDEFTDRSSFISSRCNSIHALLIKCPNLKIHLNCAKFEREDQECLRGLALMNGAQMSLQSTTHFETSYNESKYLLLGFERRIIQTNHPPSCINIFF